SLTLQFDDLTVVGRSAGAQSDWIARAIATSAHWPSRRPTIPVTRNAAFWAALFSKRSTLSCALAPALSLRLRRIRHGTRRGQQARVGGKEEGVRLAGERVHCPADAKPFRRPLPIIMVCRFGADHDIAGTEVRVEASSDSGEEDVGWLELLDK